MVERVGEGIREREKNERKGLTLRDDGIVTQESKTGKRRPILLVQLAQMRGPSQMVCAIRSPSHRIQNL